MVSSLIHGLIIAFTVAPALAQSNLFDNPVKTPAPVTAPSLSAEQRGDIMMARKMYREAVDVYREGPPNSAILHNKTGIAFHQMLQFNLARKEYEQSIKLNPRYAEAINNLGAIYYAEKSYRRAIRQYQKALAITPEAASIHSNLGSAYFARKEYPKAAQSYQKALELDPEVFEHHNQYGTLLQERSTTERAKFHYYLAKTYAKAGMNDRALLYIRKALEEGFTERKKFMEDAEFTNLRELPEFKELMALAPRVL
jgi:tetratricopeptide (TPR) repeat protein